MPTIYTSLLLNLRDPIKVPVYNALGESVDEVELPLVFRLPVRNDIIRRVYYSEFTARLQPKGRDPLAGKRTTAESLGVGYGLARVPRIKGSTRAAFAPMTVGGRLAHPPRVEKRIHEEVNKRERIIGTMSALAATARIDLVRSRGHVFDTNYLPVIITDEVLSSIKKTREAVDLLDKIGIYKDVLRAKEKTRIRAGKGKMKGRRYKVPVSILFVLSNRNAPFAKAVENLPGVDVVEPELVNILHLAPGAVPGRLTLMDLNALEIIERRFRVSLP
jgi:large subunit ribosomal protein L4e